MNEKTMRKWFKTFLMLLPFLFLAIFAIGVRKDGLKYEIPNTDEGFIILEEKWQADEDGYINIADMIEDSYFYLYYDAVDLLMYFEQSTYIHLGKFNDLYETEMRIDYGTRVLEFKDINHGWSTQIPQSLEEYTDDLFVDEVLYATIESFTLWGTHNAGQYNQIAMGFYINYAPTSSTNGNDLKLYVEDADIAPKIIVDRAKEADYIEGPQAVLLHFNDMINETFDFNAFGMNDFYDWMNENWFNSEAPLIVKPVFTLLVYEAIIELIFLMFSFITFVIRFAQQWIDGFYTKGGSK